MELRAHSNGIIMASKRVEIGLVSEACPILPAAIYFVRLPSSRLQNSRFFSLGKAWRKSYTRSALASHARRASEASTEYREWFIENITWQFGDSLHRNLANGNCPWLGEAGNLNEYNVCKIDSPYFSVSPQSHSLISSSFQTFCLTAPAYLNTPKYGLFCCLALLSLGLFPWLHSKLLMRQGFKHFANLLKVLMSSSYLIVLETKIS